VANAAPSAGASGQEPGSPTPASRVARFWNRRRWLILDLLGIALWLYFFLKLFVADVDRAVVAAVAPSAVAIVDFRLVIYLAVIALVALTFRRTWFYAFYVVFFPLVVILWKIPYFLVRHRSWAMFLGLLQASASIFGDFNTT
jgi:hypothetical protein